MRPSDVLNDDPPPEDAEDPEEEAKKLAFPWHCKEGIAENISTLNDEFNQFRGLKPMKIFITGPPASGKSHYGKKLADYYNIPHITVKDAVELVSTLEDPFRRARLNSILARSRSLE